MYSFSVSECACVYALSASANSNSNFYQSIFNENLICFNGRRVCKATARAHVKTPAVPVAFNHFAAQPAVRERRAFVRAKVFDGVKFSVDVEEGELRAVKKFDGCAASGRNVFDAADRNDLAFAHGLFEIIKFGIESLHVREC